MTGCTTGRLLGVCFKCDRLSGEKKPLDIKKKMLLRLIIKTVGEMMRVTTI